MALSYRAPEDLDRNQNYLEEPGTYHFMVLDTNEQPVNRKNELINGFQVRVSVLAATVPNQYKKEITLTFYDGKDSDKDGGEFRRKQQGRFLSAVGLLSENKDCDIDLEDAEGRQFILTLDHQKDQTTGQPTKFLQIKGLDIWHVDDPEAAAFPKHAEALQMIPPDYRRKPESFPSHKRMQEAAKANAAAGGTSKKPAPKKPKEPATSSAGGVVDIDSL